MKIAGIYSFNEGKKFVQANFKKELKELKTAVEEIDANLYKTKESKEKTMPGKSFTVRSGSIKHLRMLCSH